MQSVFFLGAIGAYLEATGIKYGPLFQGHQLGRRLSMRQYANDLRVVSKHLSDSTFAERLRTHCARRTGATYMQMCKFQL